MIVRNQSHCYISPGSYEMNDSIQPRWGCHIRGALLPRDKSRGYKI